MKTPISSLRCVFFTSLFAVIQQLVFGQGADNPTGVTGVFNGNSTTGCSYDPYTANAQRIIPDLTVAGAVGKYPLQWSRIMNSRLANIGFFGGGGGWQHSYQWSCSATENVTTAPDSYTVKYPDGRVVTFDANINTPWLPPVGVTDRFTGAIGSGYVYLNLTDGGKVRFYQTMTGPVEGYYSFTISLPDQIIDPFAQVTTLTYNTSPKLTEVKEPGGRKLKIYYGSSGAGNGFVSEVDALASDGHVSQWVKYTYATQTFGGQPYNVLTRADYIYATGFEPAPIAYYAYQTSNKSPTGNPLIWTCQDVRYPGPMKNIKYVFVRTNPLSYGQLYQEQNFNGTLVAQLTVSGSTRTEVRGDGTNAVRGAGNPTRTFTYAANVAPYLLKTYTDFQGHTTTLSYNADGFISSIQDPNTHITNLEYLNQGFPTGVISKITHPGDGSSIQYFYTDATGAYLDHVTDELNHTTYYKRTIGTNTTYEIDYLDGGIEKYTYNTFSQVVTHTMPSNTATGGASTDSEKYSYDSTTGELLTYTPPITGSDPAPSPHPTRYHYDTNDHIDTITDPRGNVTTFFYNEIGQVTFEQHDDPDQSLIAYSYNADGTLASKNQQLTATTWAETDYVYDDYKRVTSVTDPVGDQTVLYYDAAGGTAVGLGHTDANVTRVRLPSLKVNQMLYDENLRKGKVTVGLGSGDDAVSTYTYDAVGNLKTTKDPKGQTSGATWTYNYDVRDRLINVIDPLSADRNSNGHTIDYTYDVANNKLSELPANDQAITYNSYDSRNRLLQKTVGQFPTANAVTHYTWTKAGKLDTFKDPTLNIYSYTYDRLNRLVTTSYPNTYTETWLYDIAGNLYQFKNRAGNIQTFVYDSRNRETSYTWSNGSPEPRTLTYDDASRITSCNTVDSVNFSTDTIINYTYYNDNTLKSQQTLGFGSYGDGIARTISYAYDPDGNRASVTYPGMANPSFTYDYTGRNQLQSMSDGANVVSYTYDVNGNILTRTPGSSPASSFVYDAINRVTKITHNFAGSVSKTINYGYDEVSRRTFTQRDGNGISGTADGFEYDTNAQLTKFHLNGTLSGGTVTAGAVTSYTLDASGNRTAAGGVSYVPNVLNQYASVAGLNATYNNGNLASYNGWNYTYDAMNRLTNVSGPGGVYANFYYDGLGRQVAFNANSGPGTVLSLWDGWNLAAAYPSGSSTPLNRYVYAGNDLVRVTPNPQLIYYYPDAQGSTTHTASTNGTLLERYTYDPYGTPTFYNAGGTELPNGSAYGVELLYTGQPWYPDLGLYDLRNRFFKADFGRFLQPDPTGFAGDPANLYRYCGNNPVNFIDPLGLDPPGYVPPGNRPGPGPAGGPVAPMPPSAVDHPEDPRLLQQLSNPSAAAVAAVPAVGLYYINKFTEYGYIKPAPTPFTFTNFSNSTPTPKPVVADDPSIVTVEPMIVTGQAIPSQSGTASPTGGTNPAADALNSVLSRATYRDKNGLIYDANGNVIGNASNLFQFDSTNVNIFVFPSGAMTLPSPSANAVTKLIQP
jgi:RHS repeat-associated protein